MSRQQAQADNVTMSGGGLYSLATIGARDVIDRATPQVLEALSAIDAGADSHWCFSDMGCADGGTSLGLWRSVIETVRSGEGAAGHKDIQIVYADQPGNDFNALVSILHGLTRFESYLPGAENVHVLESGSSFYLPILPEASLHLGFSATAMHWLSRKPCDIPGHIHMVGADGDALNRFSAQAAADWEQILLHRARELKPGGALVLVNFCRDEQGRYLGNTEGVNMFDHFNAVWQDYLAEGLIRDSEYLAMTLPQYYNTVEEFSRPLLERNSAVYQSGLRLKSIHTGVVRCPFAEDFRKHRDAHRFAKAYVPTIRSWNESIFAGALSPERSEQERTALIESYYQRYQSDVEQSPEQHRMDYVHAYMTITRESV